ncbi:hypothetical protein [Actinomycetospora termitidis]|uniref:Flagellar biosynthetic protein FliP n=1 Tax=Actinomycetospora termitidis TaxID=3053470 RepID=A0ABT7M502_9PSEU|nr:hypothetical protein [Actinomycetospora sp. Odt1-22]MDL5155531.1 hypothetical protein [Actinomycetospora sp. Odt1-22]
MTTTPHGTRHGTRCALRHYGEMVLAMAVGMGVLAAVGATVTALGGAVPAVGPEVETLVMTTAMAGAMALWMRHRGHAPRAVAEMSAAMYVPFVALFPLLWTGAIDAGSLMMWSHVLMLPAMAVPMLLRPREYTHR